MGSGRLGDDSTSRRVQDALAAGKRRTAGGEPRTGAPAVLALQRRAGNAAVNALIAGRMKFPGASETRDIDAGLRELRRDEPGLDTVEKGLKAAQAAGVPVDLEGVKPPPSALAVRMTGFGPEAVPAKKPVPPPKPVPGKSPVGKAAAKAPVPKGAGGAGPARTAAVVDGQPPATGAAPTTALTQDKLLEPPAPPAGTRPDEDPAFTRVTGKVRQVGKAKRAHPPAASKAAEAQGAALAPSDDRSAQAKAAKADSMDAQQPGSFDKKAFISAVKAAIEAKSPRTLEEADEYKESGKAGEVKGEVKGLVTQGKEGQAKDIETATEAAPDESKAVAKPVTPLRPEDPGGVPPAAAGGAAPKPAPPEQLNLAAGTHQANQELAGADVDEQQLQQSNEPEFQQAVAAKHAAKAHAATAPQEFRQHEQQVIAEKKADAAGETEAGLTAMQSTKSAALAALVADKGKAKSKDEAKRAEVTSRIQALFSATEADVKKLLDGIDPKVEAVFNEGEAGARAEFESYVSAKMAAYKKDRYGGWLGGYRWLRDKIAGMPAKVDEFYVAGRELYLERMDAVISKVADIVGKDLTAAKQRIAAGRSEIAAYVKSLPRDLQKVGAEASQEIGERFAQLESDVDATQDSVVDTLATKYVEARKGLDERIEALQAENKGLVDKAIGAIKAVINTIRQLAAMLRDVLSRAAGVVGQIVKNPVGFLGNLIQGIKGGILRFKDNIVDHLRKGLMGWLFGALAEGGVELPESFDVKGIIKLLASIFGLTWRNIRNRIVRQIGEKAMGAVETGVSVFQTLAGEGIGGLWELLVEKLGDIKEMILEQVKDFVVTKVITAGITWLIGLLNPAAAFIKACKLIYDVVMFFVSNASRIAQFVNTVLDSVTDVVRGNIGGVVSKIENVLGQMVPLLIGFLASVIGLGGIGEKVRKIVETLQRPFNKAIDAVVRTGLKLAAPLIRGLKGIGAKVKAKVTAGKAYVRGRVEAAKRLVRREDGRSPEERRTALHAAMAGAQKLLTDKDTPTATIRKRMAGLKKEHRVRKLELVVDARTTRTETVHVMGANSPAVEGPPVTRPVTVVHRSNGEEVTETSAAIQLRVGEEIYTVWTIGGRSVRVRIEQGDEVEIRADASVQAAVKRLTGSDLEMDEVQARRLADALAQHGFLSRQLLLQYVSNKSHGMEPEDFAKKLSKEHKGTRAAIQLPVGKAGRDLLVDKGTTAEGQQRESPLTNIAHVFYPRRSGEWKDRQIQSTGAEGSKGIEFVWLAADQPQVVSLGVIEVDDDGAVSRIVSATMEAGGPEGLEKIMVKAGWRLRLRPPPAP